MTRVFIAFLFTVSSLAHADGQSNLSTNNGYKEIRNELRALERSDSLPALKRLEKLDSISHVAHETGDSCLSLHAKMLTSLPLNTLGEIDSSLLLLLDLEEVIKVNCDSHLYESYLNNLTYTLILLEDYSGVDSIGKTYTSPEIHDSINIHDHLGVLNNIGEAAFFLGDANRAHILFNRAIDIASDYGREDWIHKSLSNSGICFATNGDLDSAYTCFQRATNIGAKFNKVKDQVGDVINLANIALMRSQPQEALRLLLDSLEIALDTIENIELRADFNYTKFYAYDELKNYRQAIEALSQYIYDREQIVDEKRVTAVAEMLEKYEAEKKAREIEELKVDNLNAELKNERVARTRNLYMFGGIGIFLMALGLGSRLVVVRRAKEAIQVERDKSDGLLLNILPLDVAEELKHTGKASARNVDDVTILFSDFVGFTAISGTLTPSELVSELNEYFTAFDGLMKKYNIEKIKTIGDAYMAAAGLTSNAKEAAISVVMAALEMQKMIDNIKQKKQANGQPFFEMRIGLNTGPVVSGVVGESKFQFDIWGDAVNVASRMESNGEVNRINISRSTYELIKDHDGLSFTSRGWLDAKGKGKIEMFFVEEAA